MREEMKGGGGGGGGWGGGALRRPKKLKPKLTSLCARLNRDDENGQEDGSRDQRTASLSRRS